MNFVSQEKYEESRHRRFKKLEKRKRERGEELVKNYVYKGDK